MLALGLQREVHNQNAVFLHNTDEENDADDSHDAEILAEEDEREHCADASGGQRGENCNGVDETLIEDAKYDVDRDQSGKNEQRFIGERILERRSCALKTGLQAGGEVKVLSRLLNVADRSSQRSVGREIE